MTRSSNNNEDDEFKDKEKSDKDRTLASIVGTLTKRNAQRQESTKKAKNPVLIGVVTVVLVEGKGLLAMDDNGYSDPYVKGRLGNERFKSKYKEKTLSPRWLEQFDMPLYEDASTVLEISVWDHDMSGKDDIMGRGVLDLATLEKEKTHTIKMALEDGAGIVTFLVTITATTSGDTKTDMATYRLEAEEKMNIIKQYAIKNTPKAMKDIGWLQIKVIKAEGIASADLGGKSDPFCVVELVNTRAQTPTIFKTLQPEWGKVYQFNIKDIHEILEVTVYDEDRDRKVEFLGKVLIPLLRIRNGEKRWYQLKDRKALVRVKGAILLDLEFVYNPVRAAIRTINPREEKYIKSERKFKIAEMKRNIDRLKQMGEAAAEGGKFMAYCLSWQSKPKSALACLVYCLIVWNFQLYFLPLGLLALFLKNLLVIHIAGNMMKEKTEDEYVEDEEEDDEEEKDAKKTAKANAAKQEEKKGLREKWQAMQDMMYEMQEKLEMAATMGEKLKNAANFTVPWLSWLAIIAFSIATVVLYFVPLRILLLAWGINKFSKKLKDPNFVDNNELLDYLSRVPSDKELIMYRELRPDPGIGSSKKRRA